MEATCVAWEPTTPEANRYMILNVQYLGWAMPHIAGVSVGCELAMIVSATLARGSEREHFRVWRILFHGAYAYRCTSSDRWRGPCPWSSDESITASTNAAREVATWEIVDSQWITDAVSENASIHYAQRHFVVASSYEFIDVAARDWTDATQDEEAFWQVARALGYRGWGAIRPGTTPEALGYPGKGVPGIVAPLDTARRPESVEDELIIIRDSAPPITPQRRETWRCSAHLTCIWWPWM
jgi:hypothetical protein